MTSPPTLAMMLNACLLVGCSAAVALWNSSLAEDLVANPTGGGGSVQLEPAPAGSQPRKNPCNLRLPQPRAGDLLRPALRTGRRGTLVEGAVSHSPVAWHPRCQRRLRRPRCRARNPNQRSPSPTPGNRAAAACATSARSSTTACGQATRRAKPRNSGTAGAVSTPRSIGRAADTGPALDSRVSEEKRMNSNTLLRIGVVLFACTAALAGCSRKTDETPTATQPTAPAATTAGQAAPEPAAAPGRGCPGRRTARLRLGLRRRYLAHDEEPAARERHRARSPRGPAPPATGRERVRREIRRRQRFVLDQGRHGDVRAQGQRES